VRAADGVSRIGRLCRKPGMQRVRVTSGADRAGVPEHRVGSKLELEVHAGCLSARGSEAARLGERCELASHLEVKHTIETLPTLGDSAPSDPESVAEAQLKRWSELLEVLRSKGSRVLSESAGRYRPILQECGMELREGVADHPQLQRGYRDKG
jgi:hypothetical protein